MDSLTPSTSSNQMPAPVNLDPPAHDAPPSRESGVGQDPVEAPTQAEDVPRVSIDEAKAAQADAEGKGFAAGNAS